MPGAQVPSAIAIQKSALIAASGVALLPAWARDELQIGSRLPHWAGERGGALATKAVRWGLSAALPEYPTL